MRWCAATTAWRNSPLLLVRQRVPSICIIGRLFWTAGRRQDGWNQDARHVHRHVEPGRRNHRIQPRGQWDHTRRLTSLQGRPPPLYVMKNYGRPEKLGAIDYFQASKVAGVAVLRGSLATSASVPCVVLGIVKWPVADSQIPPIPRILRALLGRSALAARMCGLMCTMHAPSGTPRLLCVVAWAAGRLQCPRC